MLTQTALPVATAATARQPQTVPYAGSMVETMKTQRGRSA